MTAGATVADVAVRAYAIPTDAPESDGTLSWDSTTIVLARVSGGGHEGLGWTYGHRATALVIADTLAGVVRGRDALDVPGASAAMIAALRNNGRPGISSMAVAAVDVALWDLKARLLQLPLAQLLGRVHEGVPIYGSGGFTSYDDEQLAAQLAGWAQAGIPRVKMKVGREAARDPARVRVAREAIGDAVELFVDANGAYSVKQALALADEFAASGVRWFEEPVSSDDLAGLAAVRSRAPSGMDVAAGEYGYDLPYFARMVEAVDVLQADVTRCGGITELLRVDGLCHAHSRPLSLHCSPAIHASAAGALQQLVHLEYFHDHVRIEGMLFDGTPQPRAGVLHPDLARPGLGVELREADAERFATWP
jgi:L-alanine-DL-glutamate epimerase-like enolase superfamily enzyme